MIKNLTKSSKKYLGYFENSKYQKIKEIKRFWTKRDFILKWLRTWHKKTKRELENLDIFSKGDRKIMNFRAFELKKHDLNLNIDNVNF